MKTNNFFDLDRFFGLLKQDILFNYKFYMAFIVGLNIGIYLLSYLQIRYFFNGATNYSAYYLLYSMLNGATIVFVGMSFPAFRNQMKTGNFLLIPGSAFEKILVQFVIRFLLFIPLALVFLKLDVFLAIASMVPDPKSGFDPLFVEELSIRKLFTTSEVLKTNILRDLAYLVTAFAGSVYFKRYAVVKSFGIMLIFPASVFIFAKFTEGQISWPQAGTNYLAGTNFYFGLTPLFLGLSLLSLPWAYFKLKEKEL